MRARSLNRSLARIENYYHGYLCELRLTHAAILLVWVLESNNVLFSFVPYTLYLATILFKCQVWLEYCHKIKIPRF